MDYGKRKKKYFDKLKNIGLRALQNDNDAGISDIQNENDSTCFDESNPQYVKLKCEPNDLLSKVQRYIRANPTSHVTKGSLTVGKHQRSLRSNVENKNNYVDVIRTDRVVQDSADTVSPFVKPKRMLVNREPDSEIKIVPPNATSTIKQPTHSFPLKNEQPKCTAGNERGESNRSSSSENAPSTVTNGNTREFSSKLPGQEMEKSTSVDEKVNSSLTSSLYLQFVISQFNEKTSVIQNVYPNNDYGVRLKKQLLQIKLKHQNKRNVKNSNSCNSPDQDNNDSFKNMSSGSTSSWNNFISETVTKSSNTPDKCMSPSSEDSFVCLTPELLFFTENSTNMELNDEQFSSPETYHLWESNRRSRSKSTSQFVGFQ